MNQQFEFTKWLVSSWPVIAGVFSILVITYRIKGKKPIKIEEVGQSTSERGAEVESYKYANENFINADQIDRVTDSDDAGDYKKVVVKYGAFRFEIFGAKNKDENEK